MKNKYLIISITLVLIGIVIFTGGFLNLDKSCESYDWGCIFGAALVNLFVIIPISLVFIIFGLVTLREHQKEPTTKKFNKKVSVIWVIIALIIGILSIRYYYISTTKIDQKQSDDLMKVIKQTDSDMLNLSKKH